MSKRQSIIVLGLVVWLSACGSPANVSNTAPANATDVSKSGGAKSDAPATPTPATNNAACYGVDAGEKAVLRSQTFAIDFEPFKNSCFVTSHDPQFKDPPLESEIAIYKNGKKVFDFPEQFNGVTVGCWVEAVAFQDVNDDKLTDIVIVGKCSAKSAPYNENMVYLNNGKSFFTREEANTQLSDSKTIKDILGYIKENPQPFANASPSNSQS